MTIIRIHKASVLRIFRQENLVSWGYNPHDTKKVNNDELEYEKVNVYY